MTNNNILLDAEDLDDLFEGLDRLAMAVACLSVYARMPSADAYASDYVLAMTQRLRAKFDLPEGPRL